MNMASFIPVLVTAVKVANERRTALSRDLAEVDGQQHSDADYEQQKKDLRAHFETSWKPFSAGRLALPARFSESCSTAIASSSPSEE